MKKLNLETNEFIALVAIAILNVLWIACNVITFKGNIPLDAILTYVMFAIAVYYVVYDYKKPHGNTIRYLFFCHAIFEAALLTINCAKTPSYLVANNLVTIILTTYMAGRLDRYKQNVVFSAIVLVCKCITTCFMLMNSTPISFVTFFACFGPISKWLAISGAYLARYKEHKEAGLEK